MENSFYYKGLFMIYDLLDITYFHNYSQSPRKAVLDLIESKDIKLLDICTGTATNAINIAAQNKTVQITGIDLSKEMLRTAKKKIRKKGLTNIKLYKMDAADTKFKAQTFDVIIISLILHELPKEIAEKLLLEAKRILKPDRITLSADIF
jgi:demethylmenaquinone methyltransferase/2-methoxy-6-polyprenyl-1,4-benzoquinol methylase